MKRFILFTSFLISPFINCFAQLPNTDIWLLDIQTEKDTLTLNNPVNITNRNGYDNQPSFSPDGTYILYTSVRDEKQADIYKYDLKTKKIIQFTNTATSEYSPNIMPDGKHISVVMVEPDSTQRLWKFPIKGGAPNLIMKEIDSVGYYCWISEDSLALVMITEPPTLEVVNVKTQKPKTVAANVSRCMYSKDGILYYISKSIDSKFNLHVNGNYASILPNEDFSFINSNEPTICTGLKTKIVASCFFQGIDKVVIDLSKYGITNITRIAISPDEKKMAIVAESLIKN